MVSFSLNDLLYADLSASLNPFTREGRLFKSGSGEVNLTTGQALNGTIENPLGSGKRIFIELLSVSALQTFTAGFGKVFINPTVGLPTTARTNVNQFIGHTRQAVAVVKSNTSGTELSGGVAVPELAFPIIAGENVTPLQMLIPPGFTMGITSGLTGLSSVRVGIVIDWIEEDI